MSETSGAAPIVGICMGSDSDREIMWAAIDVLHNEFNIPFECRVLSAHRTPGLVVEYATAARERGLKAIIAGAGGAAHLAGVIAANTIVPVYGVPMPTTIAGGLDSLLSIVPMPPGVPVATFGIGKAGATNAALFVVRTFALTNDALAVRYLKFVVMQTLGVVQKQRALDDFIEAKLRGDAS